MLECYNYSKERNRFIFGCAHAGVWNAAGLAGKKEVILCEALIDAMTFWVNGYHNVTASYGTAGFTDDHMALFRQYDIERILIAYDRDDAGNTTAIELSKQLQQQGFGCYRLNFPKGMDANQYALDVTPATKSLGLVIRAAEWMGDDVAPARPPEVPAVSVTKPEPTAVLEKSESPAPLAADPVETVLPPAAALPDAPPKPIEVEINEREVHLNFF